MRRFLILLCVIGSISATALAQAPTSEDQLLALVKEVQAQQAQLADNQAKIEAKLAEVAESVRVARIYSKREK